MKPRLVLLGASLVLVSPLCSSLDAAETPKKVRRNDEMFPATPAAKACIDVDGQGFVVNGRRTFVACGEIQYPRIPRELWRDRLMRLARGGFNCVESYLFWNVHEQPEGVFDFTHGECDYDAFLKTAQEVGLLALARVGPYVCAEYDNGGFPNWLGTKPGINLRSDDPVYLAAVDRYWEKALPICAARQIHRGGNVIMVQLENEFWTHWGTSTTNSPYLKHLLEIARKQGVEVPHFFSGLHHGHHPYNDPVNNPPWDTPERQSPWFSTETWSRWFTLYGECRTPEEAMGFARCPWAQIAQGANGFNIYIYAGGTNLKDLSGHTNASSYDFGSCVGQAGSLRSLYYLYKRMAWFARTFSAINQQSRKADAEYADFAKPNNGVSISARKSPAGTLVFLDSGKVGKAQTLQLQTGEIISLESCQIWPIVLDARLTDAVKIQRATVRVFALATQGTTDTLVIYGKPGEKGTLALEGRQAGQIVKRSPALVPASGWNFSVTFPEGDPEETLLECGGRTLRILAMNEAQVDRTWIIPTRGGMDVVCGPDYVGEYSRENGKPEMLIERPYGQPAPRKVLVYGAAGDVAQLAVQPQPNVESQAIPRLGAWAVRRMDAPGLPEFDDSAWRSSDEPMVMGSDSDPSPYAWYRTRVQVDQAGEYTIRLKQVKESTQLFVNGQLAVRYRKPPEKERANEPAVFVVNLPAGRNTLAFFTSHNGRSQVAVGPMDPKGIFGKAEIVVGGKTQPIAGWRLHGGLDTSVLENPGAFAPLEGKAPGVPVFYATRFDAAPPSESGPRPIYRFVPEGLSRGSVWLNGKNIGRFPEKIPAPGVYLPECWLKEGGNTLFVFDEEGALPTQARIIREEEDSREVIRVAQPCDNPGPLALEPMDRIKAAYRASLAFQKPAAASSCEKANPASQANDANGHGFWSPGKGDASPWWQADLGRPASAGACRILWAKNGEPYTLEGSLDGKAWSLLHEKRCPPYLAEEHVWFPATNLRYLRISLKPIPGSKNQVGITEILLQPAK